VTDPRNSDQAAAWEHGGWPVLVPVPRGAGRATVAPTFSVVVAAHQAEATIVEALDSVFAQTRPALEVIVCDDGSTDATAGLLAGYGSPITVVRQENRGEAAAKNAAVRAARGDFVVVLDADDVFLPRRLEALAWLAGQRPDLDVLTTDASLEVEGRPVRRAYHDGWPFPVDDQRSAILTRNFVFGLAAVRRDRWLAVGGFDEAMSRTADWDFWMRLILSGSRVGLVDEPLARYRLGTSTLSADRTRLVAARVDVLSRAAARDDLSDRERATALEALARQRLDLSVRRADDALDVGGWPARVRNAQVLVQPGATPRRRLAAAVAVASPALARWRRRRRTDTVEIGAGLRVPRRADG
jgi:glycosyltransferase involved in cell wall biosynthesis